MDIKKGGATIEKGFTQEVKLVSGQGMVCQHCGGLEFTQIETTFQKNGVKAISADIPICTSCQEEYKKQNNGNRSNSATVI